MEHFLIVYNVREGRRLELQPFNDARRAADAYAKLEVEYGQRADSEDYEIVLLGADSLDTLKTTHSRYFEEVRESMPF